MILVILFIIVNIIWVCFYINQRSYLKTLMQSHDLEKNPAYSNEYMYRDEDLDYGYRFELPKYLSFRVRFQTVGNYKVSEGENGKYTTDKKYHCSFSVNKKFWEKNWFSIETDQAQDDEGFYMNDSACERIDYYPGFKEKKVWFGISNKDEDEVRNFFEEAHDEVMEVYSRAVEFFGDEYIK